MIIVGIQTQACWKWEPVVTTAYKFMSPRQNMNMYIMAYTCDSNLPYAILT